MRVHSLTLNGEYSRVSFKQIFTLHAWTAWTRTYQQSIISIFESNIWIVTANHASQQRKGTIIQFHSNTFQRL